ncbi:acyl-coenzyme A oxidase [Haloactinospora alba]|uniref:Acyl-coenzyme A oxidase n=1 Tax=Haloactinospora alba TaxID=405555 RepID=A0A543NL38_9ACTN|nr:hypothetical protein [Haloactinospora alba]TQN32507.1 acyl-coenzyme A oxidase [Haloactinospora alba]
MADPARDIRTRLEAAAHGLPVPEPTAASLFDHEVFSARSSVSPDEHYHLTHERMRVLNQRLGGGRSVLRSPEWMLAVLEHAAMIDPSLFLRAMVHYAVCLNAAVRLGDGNEELTAAVDRLDTLATVGGVLITEVGRGNSHISVRTRAEYDPELPGFRITTPAPEDAKFMPPVGLPGVPKTGVVYARLFAGGRDRGVFPYLVDIRDEHGPRPGIGVDRLPDTSVTPLDYSLVSFDNAPVPFGRWLRDTAEITPRGEFREPEEHAQQRLVRSLTVSSSASAAGAAALAAATRATAAIAHRYARHRRTESTVAEHVPVIDYRVQQDSLFGAISSAYATTFLVDSALRRWAEGRTTAPEGDDAAGAATWAPWTAVNRELSLAKVSATTTAERVCAEARRRCGAQGVLTTNRIPSYEALAQIYNSAGGDNRLILLDVGRALAAGTGYQPPRAERPSPPYRSLTDPRMCSYLLRADERWLHEQASAAVGTGTAPDALEEWNDHLWLLLELASAHARRLEFQAFGEAVGSVSDPRASRALRSAYELWELDAVGQRAATHLAHGRITAEEYLALPRLRSTVLRSFDGPVLAEGLGVPFDQLSVPIADPDYPYLLKHART